MFEPKLAHFECLFLAHWANTSFFYFFILRSWVNLTPMQKIKKIPTREHGGIWGPRWPLKMGFWAAQARGWAQPKSFWVVPKGGLGVYKSTPKFGSQGSQGAVSSTFQFYYIEMTPNLGGGLAQPRGPWGRPFFGGWRPLGRPSNPTIKSWNPPKSAEHSVWPHK